MKDAAHGIRVLSENIINATFEHTMTQMKTNFYKFMNKPCVLTDVLSLS